MYILPVVKYFVNGPINLVPKTTDKFEMAI